MVVAVGPATRLTRFVQQQSKTYVADFQFGVTSDSDDSETELRNVEGAETFTELQLEMALENFVGSIEQTPPAYSAVKIAGKRAYRLARSGESFEIQSKTVEIYDLDLLSFEYPNCQIKIECGSGTYIRSLGRDLGRVLNSGAVMTGLFREAVGQFAIRDAIGLDEISMEVIQEKLIAPARLFENSEIRMFTGRQMDELAVGGMFSENELSLPGECDSFVALNDAKQLIAVFERHRSGQFKPAVNFVHYFARSPRPSNE